MRIRNIKRRLCATAAVGLLVAGVTATAHAATILEVNFEDDLGFTADDDGVASDGNNGTWERRALGDTPFSKGSSQQDGMIFYGRPRDNSAAPTLTLDAFDFSGYTDLQLEISLAATEEQWEDYQVDKLIISALNVRIVDRFLPVGDQPGDQDLQSVGLDNALGTGDDGPLLGWVFEDFVYDLASLGPLGLTEFRITAQGTGSAERFGIDSIRITGTAAPMPEPTTALLFGVGSLVVGGAVRRRTRPS